MKPAVLTNVLNALLSCLPVGSMVFDHTNEESLIIFLTYVHMRYQTLNTAVIIDG